MHFLWGVIGKLSLNLATTSIFIMICVPVIESQILKYKLVLRIKSKLSEYPTGFYEVREPTTTKSAVENVNSQNQQKLILSKFSKILCLVIVLIVL